ncbi:hypothetical protein C8R44DRAFT_233134 [Mycena epipterygia]|nr:hypothetical protein C8R44DRAFT_233134 [Mycena epipterygia]
MRDQDRPCTVHHVRVPASSRNLDGWVIFEAAEGREKGQENNNRAHTFLGRSK